MYNQKQIYETIIILNGKPQSGKDTFSNFIHDYLKEIIIKDNYKNINIYFENLSTVDHIKEIAKKHFGWNGIKDNKGRKLLSDLKLASSNYNNGPFQTVLSARKINHTIVNLNSINIFVTVIHSREPDEIKKFQDFFGEKICSTVLIKRNTVKDMLYLNDSDNNVNHFFYDYIIENNGDLKSFQIETYKLFETILKTKNEIDINLILEGNQKNGINK